MAVESVTIGDIVNSVRFAIQSKQSTLGTDFDAEITKAISWTLRDLVSKTNHPAYRTESTFTCVVGTRDNALAADVERIIEPGVRFDAAPFTTLKYDEQQDFDEAHGRAVFTSNQRPFSYTLRGRDSTTGYWSLRLLQPPDDTYVIRYNYLAIPTNHKSSSSGTELDPRFPRAHWQGLVFGALTAFPQYLGQDQTQLYAAKYQEVIRAMSDRAAPVIGDAPQGEAYRAGFMGRGKIAYPGTLYSGSPIW